MTLCQYCGGLHSGTCPRVRAIDYYPTGAVRRVEFVKTEAELGAERRAPRPGMVEVDIRSTTSALRDLATLNSRGSVEFVTEGLRKLAARIEQMAAEAAGGGEKMGDER